MRGFGSLLVWALAGRGETIARPHTEEELEAKCVMRGGWWHRGGLREGFCEFQAPGFL